MSTVTKNTARLNVRLPAKLKEIIEEAATLSGQSVSDFAVSSLVQTAQQVIEQRGVTELSNRDREVFVAMLDDSGAKPNKALKDAAARYRKHLGRTK